MQRFFIVLGVSLLFVVPVVVSVPTQVHAEEMSLSQLIELFISLGIIPADKAVAARSVTLNSAGTSASVSTPASPSASCTSLSNNLHPEQTDSNTNGEVSKLQTFLGGRVTGYFGPATVKLVQNWQASHGIVSSGSPTTTGYGAVGSKTRTAMAGSCNGGTSVDASAALELKRYKVKAALVAIPGDGLSELSLWAQKVKSIASTDIPQARSFLAQWGDKLSLASIDFQTIEQKDIETNIKNLTATELDDQLTRLAKIQTTWTGAMATYNTIPSAELQIVHNY